jgi:putative Mg2+ transporter-C (MgtC) family protein
MESVSLDSLLDSFLKLLLATLCGGVIGFERKTAGKPAGLRTNMLICVGSALIMILSIHLSVTVSENLPSLSGMENRINGDPARLAAQVVSGIGFLGAGAIMQSRGSVVVGLTTAATIWANSAIGLCLGAGYYALGVITTSIVLFILYVVRFIESKTNSKQPRSRTLTIIHKKGKKISQIKNDIYRKGIFIGSESIKKRVNEVEYKAEILIPPFLEENLINQLSEDDHILTFNITNTI